MVESPFVLAGRTARITPSVIRELMKFAERPNLIGLAGGLPSAETFPVRELREAVTYVLEHNPREALQYAATDGFMPLREWVAARSTAAGLRVEPAQVLITTGSQQGLDLIGKVLLEKGATFAVEGPTYLGAMQAFAPYEADATMVECDDGGPRVETMEAAQGARFFYALPNFQNPSGCSMDAPRRAAVAARARAMRMPLVEDDPYGDLWFDAPPPAPLASHWPEGTIYLGSFSKVLAPGLRLGYLVSPPSLHHRIVEAKQAADLHTSNFVQRVVHRAVTSPFFSDHLAAVRARYRIHRDAMAAALAAEMPSGCRWVVPSGGMFFWVELPEHIDATALLSLAIDQGVAFVPGTAFFAREPRANTLRLSFVTESPERIASGIRVLASLIARA